MVSVAGLQGAAFIGGQIIYLLWRILIILYCGM